MHTGAAIDAAPGARKAFLTIFASGQNWVACTPEGYFAASPGGEKMVGSSRATMRAGRSVTGLPKR